MKKFILFLITLFFEQVLFAQALDWTHIFGGTGYDNCLSTTLDSEKNIYVTGFFSGTIDFDPSSSVATLTSYASSMDSFIAKYDKNGNYIWAKRIGNAIHEKGKSIKVDENFNVYILGDFWGYVDFDPSPNTYYLNSNGSSDVFLLKLNVDGNFIWAQSFGSNSYDYGNSLCIDKNGNIYAAGIFQETVDFDAGSGVNNLISNGYNDGFIVKVDSNGNFMWAKQIGGSFQENLSSIAIDNNGAIITIGSFSGTVDFNFGSTSYLLNSINYSSNAFIAKYNSSGELMWVKKIGSDSTCKSQFVAVDNNSNIYVTGNFRGMADFDFGSSVISTISNGRDDIFFTKLDSMGNFLWVKSIGGNNYESAHCITSDIYGNTYLSGFFMGSVDFDPSVNSTIVSSANGYGDIFISKYNPYGDFQWIDTYFGTGSYPSNSSIIVNDFGDIYFSGPIGAGFGGEDVFISKYSQSNFLNLNSNSILLFPNPTNSNVYIDFGSQIEKIEVMVFNSIGQKKIENLYTNIANLTVNIETQPIGLYIFIFKINGDKTYNLKVIKK